MNKRGGFDRPSDLVIIGGILMIIVVTAGLGVTSLEAKQGVITSEGGFWRGAGNGTSYLANTTTSLTEIVSGVEGGTVDTTEDSIYQRGVTGLTGLGDSWQAIKSMADLTSSSLGIPGVYWTILITMIFAVFSVVTYTWLRGN